MICTLTKFDRLIHLFMCYGGNLFKRGNIHYLTTQIKLQCFKSENALIYCKWQRCDFDILCAKNVLDNPWRLGNLETQREAMAYYCVFAVSFTLQYFVLCYVSIIFVKKNFWVMLCQSFAPVPLPLSISFLYSLNSRFATLVNGLRHHRALWWSQQHHSNKKSYIFIFKTHVSFDKKVACAVAQPILVQQP